MNVLSLQSQSTAKNGLIFKGTPNQAISVSGGNHAHPVSGGGGTGGGSNVGNINKTNQSQVSFSTGYSGNLSMSGTFTATGTISGDTETRPDNYTVKVWKHTN